MPLTPTILVRLEDRINAALTRFANMPNTPATRARIEFTATEVLQAFERENSVSQDEREFVTHHIWNMKRRLEREAANTTRYAR